MTASEAVQVEHAIRLAQNATDHGTSHHEPALHKLRQHSPLKHALAVASILAQMHIDAVGVSAGVVFEAIDAGHLSLEKVQNTLGYPVERIVSSMLRLNILERKNHNEAAQSTGPTKSTTNDETERKRRVREALRR